MQFEWLLDRAQQGQFRIFLRPGKTNLADYFMKHHPPVHHRNVQGEFLTRVEELHKLRQELDMKGVDVGSSARETGLVSTDRVMFPKCFCILSEGIATRDRVSP